MLSHRSVDTIIRLFGRAVIITCSQISIKAAFSCLSCQLWTCPAHYSRVSTFDFEHAFLNLASVCYYVETCQDDFTDESLSKVHYHNRFISCSNVSDIRLETLCKKGYNEVLFLVKLQSWTSNLIKSRAPWQVFSCKFG